MEDEMDKQKTLGLLTFTQRMSTVTFLNAAPSDTRLDQRPDTVLKTIRRKLRRTREER